MTIAAFRDDGTLVAASTQAIEEKTTAIKDQPFSSRISVAEWPPGAPEPTVRALPKHPGYAEANDNFTLTLGPAGRTILVLTVGEELEVLSGIGTAIESIGRVPAPRAYDAHAFPTPDGGTTLLWAPDGSNTPLMTAAASPGATLGASHAIRTPQQGSIDIQTALPLPGGRVAIAYDGSAGKPNLLVTPQ